MTEDVGVVGRVVMLDEIEHGSVRVLVPNAAVRRITRHFPSRSHLPRRDDCVSLTFRPDARDERVLRPLKVHERNLDRRLRRRRERATRRLVWIAARCRAHRRRGCEEVGVVADEAPRHVATSREAGHVNPFLVEMKCFHEEGHHRLHGGIQCGLDLYRCVRLKDDVAELAPELAHVGIVVLLVGDHVRAVHVDYEPALSFQTRRGNLDVMVHAIASEDVMARSNVRDAAHCDRDGNRRTGVPAARGRFREAVASSRSARGATAGRSTVTSAGAGNGKHDEASTLRVSTRRTCHHRSLRQIGSRDFGANTGIESSMGSLRFAASLSLFLGCSLCSLSASPGPTIERLVAGEATPRAGMLVAGSHGARYEIKGGSVVEFAPGAEFSFDPSRRVPLGRPGEADVLTRVVRLSKGAIDATVTPSKREPTALMVRGPSKMSAVTRSGVSTFVVSDDHSSAACRAGDTLVGIGNDWKPLKEGFARTFAPVSPAATPRPLADAPEPSFDHGFVLVRGGQPGHAIVTWAAVKDATSYDVRIARLGDGVATLIFHEPVQSTSVPTGALSPGTYSVVVAAIDKSGLSGAPSESKTLRVAGLEVPEGAVVTDDGAVVLAKEQRVRLSNAEGLEVSYGASSVFGSAPSTLGLAHNEAVVARLRAPGTRDETVIRLEPMGLRARVHIDPKGAFWPNDRVNVAVDLYDASGRAVPENADVKPTVTVNLEPLKLEWQRSGHSLRATVPPSQVPGPWVVRAEVRDGRGALLGRDFLEVAKRTYVSR